MRIKTNLGDARTCWFKQKWKLERLENEGIIVNADALLGRIFGETDWSNFEDDDEINAEALRMFLTEEIDDRRF